MDLENIKFSYIGRKQTRDMSASTSSAIARRREELYGMTRLKNAEALKSNLTTDHIGMISKEGLLDDKPSWQSTFKMNFKVSYYY